MPLLFELAMECVYPVGGGIVGGIVIEAMSVVLLLFDIAFMLPNSDIKGRGRERAGENDCPASIS